MSGCGVGVGFSDSEWGWCGDGVGMVWGWCGDGVGMVWGCVWGLFGAECVWEWRVTHRPRAAAAPRRARSAGRAAGRLWS